MVFDIERTHRGGFRAKDIMFYVASNRVYPYPPNPDVLDDDDEQLRVRDNNENQGLEKEPSQQGSLKADLIALALFGGSIRLVSLTEDGTYKFLDEQEKLHNLLYVFSSETWQVELAVEELESLMNDPKMKEGDFQRFFERHPDFILNDEYKEAHAHLVLSKDDGASLIPDFLLEPIDQNSLCDLLELKLPSADVFVLKKSRARFSAAVYEAAAQLREYSRFFDEEKNRSNFQSAYPDLKAYKPRMFVVIGRRSSANPLLQREILSSMPDLVLRTYDEVLARMKFKIEKMKNKALLM